MDYITKDQERKALAQIENILAGLGKDSYVAAAFEGCVEDARDNIEGDYMLSMRQRLQDAEAALHDAEQERDALRERVAELNRQVTALRMDSRGDRDAYLELDRELRETRRRAEDAEADVIQLKAKLYDHITAGD